MKKYLSILSAVLCLGLYSCEEKPVEPVVYAPSVLISNYGLKTSGLVDLADVRQDFSIYVERDGAYEGKSIVRLVADEAALTAYNTANNTTFRALPADCYALDFSARTMTGKEAEFILVYDVEKICALSNAYDYSDIQDYVVPLVVVSETEGVEVENLDGMNYILVNPKMSHKIVETFGVSGGEVVETAEAFTVPIKVATTEAENLWPSDYKLNVTVTDGAGEELVSGVDYILTCSSDTEAFEYGVSEIVYTVSFSKQSALPKPYEEWTVAATLEGVEGGFIVDGDGKASVKFQAPYKVFDRSAGINQESTDWANMCNSMPNEGSSPYKLLDGNPNTHWEAAWGNHHTVVTALKPPYYVIFEFKEEVEIAALSFLRRDAWRGDLKEGYIEYSDDRENWTKVVEFDYPNDNQLGPFYLVHKPTKAKYIRLWLTNSYRNNGNACGFSELNLFTLDFKVK